MCRLLLLRRRRNSEVLLNNDCMPISSDFARATLGLHPLRIDEQDVRSHAYQENQRAVRSQQRKISDSAIAGGVLASRQEAESNLASSNNQIGHASSGSDQARRLTWRQLRV